VVLSRRVAGFLLAFGVWSWIIWPVFLKNMWHDPRSWHDGMTSFFAVHLVLTVVSLALGTAIGVIGARGLYAGRVSRRSRLSQPAPPWPPSA
jgi:hypothetical protein